MSRTSLRALVKTAVFAGATVLVLPLLLSFWVRAALMGRDRALEGSSQVLSLVPGLVGDYLRRAFFARALAHCHRSASIGFGTVFSKAAAHISENVVIGPRCHIGLVRLDRGVLIGPGCHLPSGGRTHGTADRFTVIRDQAGEVKRVHVGEGAWIGSAAIVMADVGAHTVVAAGSLVYEPIPPAVVVGGVPVRILKRRGPSGRPVLGDPSEANTESNNVNQWGSKMTPESIERSVAQAVARLARIPEAEVDLSRSAVDNGIDSLGLLVLRESLERRLHVHITDDAWTGFDSLRDVVAYVGASSEVSAFSWADPSPARAHDVQFRPAPYLTDTGLFHDAVEIGMPITGLNNLAESPLLKYLGHLRWSHLSAVCGVPSRDVTDTDGHRLYPTFFYIDLQFPEHRHMASYGENDRLKVVSTLERFGASMLDGVIYLLPGDWPDGGPLRFDGLATAVAAGVPAARMSNIFVKQFGGAEWLKKSRPANSGFDRIREVAVAPDSYRAVKEAERNGCFECAPDGFVRMTPGSVSLDYDLVADRDLNGAGLVYFANYPLFLDICERRALKGCRFGLSDELLDRRSLVRRRSAYLNNASSRDTLSVEVEAWLENPAILGHPAPEAAPVRLFINHRMRRCSDGRLMMVSTAEKVLSGYCLEDLPFFKDLLAEYRDTSDQLVVGCTH